MQLRNTMTWLLLLTVIIATIVSVDTSWASRLRRRSGSSYRSRRRSYGYGSRRRSHPTYHGRTVDVAIVGAGVSGLTAAYRLKQKGHTYKVIETRTRVGGRTRSVSLNAAHGRGRWDLGGQWIGDKQYNVKKLCKELNIQTYEQHTQGNTIFITRTGHPVPFNPHGQPQATPSALLYLDFIQKVNKLAASVNVSSPESHPDAYKLDSMTIADFMRTHNAMKDPVNNGTFSNTIRGVFTAHPSEISFLFFLQVIRSGETWQAHTTSGVNTAQQTKIHGTAHSISTRLYYRVGRKNVVLGDTVTKITQGSRCLVETLKGKKIRSHYVIVAAPPSARTRITFAQPNLPVNYHHLNHHYVSGYYGKMFFTYQTAFWREQGYNGDALGANQAQLPGDSMVKAPILSTSDASYTVNGRLQPALVVFAHPHLILDQNLKKHILNALVKFFGPKAAHPLDFYLAKWFGNDTPVINSSPGALINFGKLIRKPVGRIHWAGTESATSWIGYIEGAVQSGERAANETSARLG